MSYAADDIRSVVAAGNRFVRDGGAILPEDWELMRAVLANAAETAETLDLCRPPPQPTAEILAFPSRSPR